MQCTVVQFWSAPAEVLCMSGGGDVVGNSLRGAPSFLRFLLLWCKFTLSLEIQAAEENKSFHVWVEKKERRKQEEAA